MGSFFRCNEFGSENQLLLLKMKLLRLLTRPSQSAYRLIRHLGVLDVTRLMHLPNSGFLVHRTHEGYEIRSVQRDELSKLIDAGRAPAHVGDPASLEDPRRALVLAFSDGQVVSYLWMAKQAIDAKDNFSRSSHLGTLIEMPDGTAFVYNAWTDPKHRGNRLITSLMTWATCNRVLGAWSLLTMIDWTNPTSIRAFEHVGMQPLGTIVRFGRGPLQLSIVPESAKRIGIRVAKDAPGLNWAC